MLEVDKIVLDRFSHVYFLGIGGIGMSALARYFVQHGFKVAGYDKTHSALTNELETLGIAITFEQEAEYIAADFLDAEKTLVIRTPAVPANHQGWLYFQEKGFTILKRAQILGLLTRHHKGLAVAGTHGKTTTSTLLAHLLHESPLTCNAFLGGISSNFNSNYISDKNAEYTVIEADEFDRSFHQLRPYCSIITAMDSDHLDIYGTEENFKIAFQEYVDLIHPGGLLIHHLSVDLLRNGGMVSYHLNDPRADYHLENLKYTDGKFYFDVVGKDINWQQVEFGLPGTHNAENALACIIQATWLGMSETQIRSALASFKGVKRRFDYHIREEEFAYIDDYAHHPTEIKALMDSIDLLYPGYEKIGVFQPHLFSRTRDFFEGFAQQLSRLDHCILLPIYPAREEAIPGITSDALLAKITAPQKRLLAPTEAISNLHKGPKKVVLTIGAGDIDRMVTPLKQKFENE